MSGCSDAQDGSSTAKIASSLQDLFSQWLSSPDATDYDRGVLEQAAETASVSQAQYQQALDQYVSCMSDAGYELQQTRYSTGVINVQPSPAVDDVEALMAADQLCRENTSVSVVMGYDTQQGNPNLYSDPPNVAYTCLKDHSWIASDVTVAQVSAFLTETHRNQYPFDVHDLGVKSCFYAAGMVYDSDSPD